MLKPSFVLDRCGRNRHRSGPVEPGLLQSLEPRVMLAVDLVAGDLNATVQSVEPGENIIVEPEFANEGDSASSSFRIQVRLSSDEVFGNGDDIVLGRIVRPGGLAADEIDSQLREFTVPESTPEGSYRVAFRVDSLNTNAESDENNNITISDSALITVGTGVGGDGEIEIRGRNGVTIADGDTTPSFTDFTAFGRINTDGGSRDRTFTIYNVGDGDLNIDDLTITGAGSDGFEIVSHPDSPIGPDESAELVIRFDPDRPGVHRAVVTVTSNDPDDSVYTFTISGTGRPVNGPPEISVTGLAPINDGDRTASTSDGTNFGVATVGGSIERTFTITNTGSGDLNVASPFISVVGRNPANFTIVQMPDDTSLGVGESTTFVVRFSTNTPGTRKATIQVLSNDADEGVFDFEVRGRGHPNT